MNVLTITANPAVDKSTKTNLVMPEKKIRCHRPVYEPGGGGINVSRALKKLGSESTAMYFAGGSTGDRMHELLVKEELHQNIIKTIAPVRENLIVLDETDQQHYRFGMPGPEIKEEEWKKMLDEIDKMGEELSFVVLSGSLPPGVPEDFAASIAQIAKRKDIKFITDTSGKSLKTALDEGVFLAKPNQLELKNLMGEEKIKPGQLEIFARQLVKDKKAEVMVVSLGAKGALYATSGHSEYIMSPVIDTDSAVGAGDSMVAGMIHGFLHKKSVKEAVIYGIAAGTAATITPGTELCRRDDTDEVAAWIRKNEGMTES